MPRGQGEVVMGHDVFVVAGQGMLPQRFIILPIAGLPPGAGHQG